MGALTCGFETNVLGSFKSPLLRLPFRIKRTYEMKNGAFACFLGSDLSNHVNDMALNHLKNKGSVLFVESPLNFENKSYLERGVKSLDMQFLSRNNAMEPGDHIRIKHLNSMVFVAMGEEIPHVGEKLLWKDMFASIASKAESNIAGNDTLLVVFRNPVLMTKETIDSLKSASAGKKIVFLIAIETNINSRESAAPRQCSDVVFHVNSNNTINVAVNS